MKLDDLWAKTEPWQSLEAHSKVSGIVAQVILGRMLAKGTVELLAKELGMDKTILFLVTMQQENVPQIFKRRI